MQTRVQKWGNSLAVRIPRPFALEVGLLEDAQVEISVEGGRLVLEPRRGTTYTLPELLARVSEGNLHGEVDDGLPVGREIW